METGTVPSNCQLCRTVSWQEQGPQVHLGSIARTGIWFGLSLQAAHGTSMLDVKGKAVQQD